MPGRNNLEDELNSSFIDFCDNLMRPQITASGVTYTTTSGCSSSPNPNQGNTCEAEGEFVVPSSLSYDMNAFITFDDIEHFGAVLQGRDLTRGERHAMHKPDDAGLPNNSVDISSIEIAEYDEETDL